VFDKVGMPHVMQDLQGHLAPVYRSEIGEDGKEHHVIERIELVKPGKLTLAEYDAQVGDLVNYLNWMGEPAKGDRMRIGLAVYSCFSAYFM
jgi:ubiquinol-cytochrome c reductase cytochrome c1 subunit